MIIDHLLEQLQCSMTEFTKTKQKSIVKWQQLINNLILLE